MAKISTKAIGLLGGSFDPAHRGHLKISKIAIKKLKLNAVLWLVTKKNPFKEKPLYPIEQRLALAKRITKNIRNIKVIHLDKTVKSTRSIDIINYLIIKKKLKVIYFIIGSDNLIEFTLDIDKYCYFLCIVLVVEILLCISRALLSLSSYIKKFG